MERPLIKPGEVAAALKIKSRTVMTWARARRIPFIRVNARVFRFCLADVVAALKKGKV